ncbi:MAG: hypothetical protein M1827_000216 [Pycnora praestabilis]|nr:MAG: hypothetical protein M1827_000216 [Pycnora praestabilis]
MSLKKEALYLTPESEEETIVERYHDVDVFGEEKDHQAFDGDCFMVVGSDPHQIQYKTLSWQLVASLMITEIVSNGMLSLPSALAVVGIVPGVIIIVFLGVFATYTSWLLIQFKLNHPEGSVALFLHNMGDAGLILFGPIGREILSFGTIVFAIFATGSQLLAGQIALASLSGSKLCLMLYTGIFAIPTLLFSMFRTLDKLSWLTVPGFFSITIAGILGMIAAGIYPTPGREVTVAAQTTFYEAFISITNPVFAYAGHFMFFILISEMKRYAISLGLLD